MRVCARRDQMKNVENPYAVGSTAPFHFAKEVMRVSDFI